MRTLALLAAMTLPAMTLGQCRGSITTCATPFVTHHADAVVATPVVAAVPTAVIEVPVPTFVFQVLPAYSSPPLAVAPAYQAPAAAFAAATPGAKCSLTDEELERIADKVAARLTRPAAAGLPVAADDGDPTPTPTRPAESRAANFFAANCKSCHGDSNAKGDFKLFAGNTIDPRKASDGSPVPWAVVYDKVDTGGGSHAPAMPPSARADRAKWADADVLDFVRSLAAQQQQPR